jgi:hypothetical protein
MGEGHVSRTELNNLVHEAVALNGKFKKRPA